MDHRQKCSRLAALRGGAALQRVQCLFVLSVWGVIDGVSDKEGRARWLCRSPGRLAAAEGNSGRQNGLYWRFRARNKLVNSSIAQEKDRLTRMVEARRCNKKCRHVIIQTEALPLFCCETCKTSRFRSSASWFRSRVSWFTPAMAAGVTARLWGIDDIVGVLEAWEAAQ